MNKLAFLLSGLFMLVSSAVFTQGVTINASEATEALRTTVNKVLPGNLNIDNFESDGTDANCKVSASVDLIEDTKMDLTATFNASGDNTSAVVTGSFSKVKIGKLLQAFGLSHNNLPSNFTNSEIDALTVTINPNDKRLTATMLTNLGLLEINGNKDAGFMMGINPDNLGDLVNFNELNSTLNGFTLIYSSKSEEEDSALDLLSDVKVQSGLNLYWTGKLPKPLRRFLSPAGIPGINKPITFVCSESLIDQIEQIPPPTLTYNLGGFSFSILDFENIGLNLNLSDASIGLTGEISTSELGQKLVLNGSSIAKFDPAQFEYELSCGDSENPLLDYIPGIIVNSLLTKGTVSSGTNASVVVGGEAAIGTTNKPITMGVTIGPGTFEGSINELSIPAIIEAFTNENLGGLKSALDLGITNGNVTVDRNKKETVFKGTANIFGLGSDFDITSNNTNFNMEADLDPIELKAGSTTLFSLTGDTERGGAKLNLDSKLSGTFTGEVELLGGPKVESNMTITPSEITFNVNQSLFGSGLSADLKVTAKNFTTFYNADFVIDATINKDELDSTIVEFIKKELKSVDPLYIAGNAFEKALKAFNVEKIGFKTSLNGFNKAKVNVHVDAILAGQKIPINISVNLNSDAIEKIAEATATKIANELLKVGSVLLKGLEDIGEGVYLAGKAAIDWTGGAANTSAKWLEGQVGVAIKWVEGVGGKIFGEAKQYDCGNEEFTAPSNGKFGGIAPPDIEQYRVRLQHIMTTDDGHESNSTLELWGSITVKTNMAMQEDANPWLYNNSCRTTTKCKLNEANTDINHFIDFFIESGKVSTSYFDIELDIHEGDPGADDPFKKETISIVYGSGKGLPLMPGQIKEHSITLEDNHNNPQKIEVKLSIERIIEPVNSPVAYIKFPNASKYSWISSSRIYLSSNSSGDVFLSTENRANNLSKWEFVNQYDGSYKIKINGGTKPDKFYLGSTANGDVKLFSKEDNSDRQKWVLTRLLNDQYFIKIKGGVNNEDNYLSIGSLEKKIKLLPEPTSIVDRIIGDKRREWVLKSTIGKTCNDGKKNQGETSVDCGGPNCDPCPTCNDGIQNQEETDVDCGGPNCDTCPTCHDGIQNQGETGVDCGGPNCYACPTCDDGIMNQGETGVDCGSPCAACLTCDDDIKNQGETSVDCGGPNCEPCPPTCDDGILNQGETALDCGGPNCEPCPPIIILKNVHTKRFLFSTGNPATSNEGGWTNSPTVVGTDENYYGRGKWYLTERSDGTYYLKNSITGRLLFSAGPPVEGNEGGWTNSPAILGTDANYYNRAQWILTKHSNGYYTLRNKETNRLLFSPGTVVEGDSEGGWLNSPSVLGADENYYSRAYWEMYGPGTPSCNDGIQNQGETSIDCGGPNCVPCPTCDDGIQNQEETGVDCGGPNCDPCPTCDDGIQNQGETRVDCGGPNCVPCTPKFGDDFYKIVSKASRKVVTVNTANGNIAQNDFNDKNDQMWRFINVEGTNYVKIESKATEKVLAINLSNGNIVQNEYNGEDNQLWRIEWQANFKFLTIVSKATGKVADLNRSNGNISQYSFHGGGNQLWKIEWAADGSLGGRLKRYTIQHKGSDRYLDAYYKENDYALFTRPDLTNLGYWTLEALGNDTYRIKQNSYNRFLDAHVKAQNGYFVMTRTRQNNNTQRWIIKKLEDGSYTIQQKHNNRYIGVQGNYDTDNSVLTQRSKNLNLQSWIIKRKR